MAENQHELIEKLRESSRREVEALRRVERAAREVNHVLRQPERGLNQAFWPFAELREALAHLNAVRKGAR